MGAVTVADSNDVFHIGGDMPVHRMGYGAMQLAGPRAAGPPRDPEVAKALLRRAVELGVTFIDTADVYGPGDNERLIRDALAPYPSSLVIGTKAGMVRNKDGSISIKGNESHIRAAIEGSLQNLGVDCIDLYQLHRVDPSTPLEETMLVLRALRDEGKLRHIGLSQVSVNQIERARAIVEIATVQNFFNLAHRQYDDVLTYCERNRIGFIPFCPLHIDGFALSETLCRIASRMSASTRQVALAWLYKRSQVTVVIPGTSSIEHLEENVAASKLELSVDDRFELDELGVRLR
ncbi:putative oxidoreductase [Acidisarcina polymorpha]|uniref:Putative oxidoreductase n=1 Tax=Acidisarcina polymorpha TaxID=2211140 RepID=A0A2Z5G067_9BACT|nr:aldo/keto reductase [Acidisarcina polymorpha]AXC12154.1 putative oxidoreductase [Acidisarcina polymorpha]